MPQGGGDRDLFLKRSLDIGLGRQDAFKLWARDAAENASIRSQYVVYQELKGLRGAIPDDTGFDALESFIGKLIRVACTDTPGDRTGYFVTPDVAATAAAVEHFLQRRLAEAREGWRAIEAAHGKTKFRTADG